MDNPLVISCSADASGAWLAGKQGNVVVIVDIIDMSTTLEAALEAGALEVFGASPDRVKVPVLVNPYQLGQKAGKKAKELNAAIIIVAEPRWGADIERLNSCQTLISGLKDAGINAYKLVPNLGISVTKLVDFQNKVVIAVTRAGGVAFDAANYAGGHVITATIARTWQLKGTLSAEAGVERALTMAKKIKKHITFVAASSKSLEDLLAAQYLTQLALIKRDFYL